MSFIVNVVSRQQFAEWYQNQRSAAIERAEPMAGELVFHRQGCGACHAIRGTTAVGRVGPELTHVGSRQSIGADWLSNDEHHFQVWLQQTKSIKPGVEMPEFDFLADSELHSLAEYLESLK